MKWDKYLLVAVSNNFLVNFSYIFENVKKLSDRKFDIFFSVIPLSRSETMAILASSGKVLFNIFFFWQKSNCSHFYKLRRNRIKTNGFFFVKCTQKFKYFFCICPRKFVKRCKWGDLIFRSSLNMSDARMI